MPFNLKAPDYIYKIKPYIPGKPIEELEREKGIKDIVKLASNENPLGPSPMAVEAIKSYLSNINRYPDGSGFYLKNKLSRFFNLSADTFILGNGSNELIDIAVRTFCDKNNNIIAPFPSFVAYYLAAEQLGIPLKISGLKDYRIDLDLMAGLIDDDTKVVFVSNPNNPTGAYLPAAAIKEFTGNVRDDILIIIDEAYVEYLGESILDVLSLYESQNVLVLRTFSKVYGLAGIRIGYGIGCKELIDLMDRVREPFNVSSIAMVAAKAALDDINYVKNVVDTNESEKTYLYNAFKKLNIDFVETGANFILIGLKNKKAVEVYKELLNKGVIVRSMDRFGYENMIRVTIGTHIENLKLVEGLSLLACG